MRSIKVFGVLSVLAIFIACVWELSGKLASTPPARPASSAERESTVARAADADPDPSAGAANDGAVSEPSEQGDHTTVEQPRQRTIQLRLPDGRIITAEIAGNAGPSPDGIVDFAPSPRPPYDDPIRDGRLENEPVDASWAPQMEATLWSVAGDIGEVRDVRCRTTFCLATLAQGDDVKAMDVQTRRPYIQRQTRFIEEIMRSVIRGSNGRLEYFGFSKIGAPQEDFEMQFYIYGAPMAGIEPTSSAEEVRQ